MRSSLFALLLSVPLLATPLGSATSPPCASATSQTSTSTGVYLIPVGGVYGFDVWLESNHVQGLQKVACIAADGSGVGPDTRLGTYGVQQGGQPVCAPALGCIWI